MRRKQMKQTAVYMNYKNDISFVFDFELMLYEHQSTCNPNMPLRDLLETCHLLKEYAQYVAQVRSFAEKMSLSEAVEKTVDEIRSEKIDN